MCFFIFIFHDLRLGKDRKAGEGGNNKKPQTKIGLGLRIECNLNYAGLQKIFTVSANF